MGIIENLNLFESKFNKNKFKIYLDMDGTITDWFKAFRDFGKDITKGLEGDEYEKKYGRDALWELKTKPTSAIRSRASNSTSMSLRK